jgi:hypothetical protein
MLVGISMFALLTVCLVEGTDIGDAQTEALDYLTGWIRSHTERILRVV